MAAVMENEWLNFERMNDYCSMKNEKALCKKYVKMIEQINNELIWTQKFNRMTECSFFGHKCAKNRKLLWVQNGTKLWLIKEIVDSTMISIM